MSLSLTLTEAINEALETFITRVSEKYNIDNTELKNIWEGDETKYSKTVSKPVSKPKKVEIASAEKDSAKIDPDVLLKCNKTELIALCKSHGHKCSGTKDVLMNRLLGKDENEENGKEPAQKTKAKTKANASQQEVTKNTPVAKKLTANIPNILIRRNKFNHYEHPETGLIFDNDSKTVIGKQNDDGTIDPLTEDDIDQCNAFKFKFKIPVNLDHKSSLLDVKVDELSEEEEEEEEELVEEDLLEDDDLLGEDEFEDFDDDE